MHFLNGQIKKIQIGDLPQLLGLKYLEVLLKVLIGIENQKVAKNIQKEVVNIIIRIYTDI